MNNVNCTHWVTPNTKYLSINGPSNMMAGDHEYTQRNPWSVTHLISLLPFLMENWRTQSIWSLLPVAGIYLYFSGFILALWYDFWSEFSTQKSYKFLIILLCDFNSMPHFSMFLLIFYHPRIMVKCGLYCFCSHFLLLVELSDCFLQ